MPHTPTASSEVFNSSTATAESAIPYKAFGEFFDLIPFVSTVSNLLILVQKVALHFINAFCGEDWIENKNNGYISYVWNKDLSEVCALLVPFVGNFIVFFNRKLPVYVITSGLEANSEALRAVQSGRCLELRFIPSENKGA